MTTKYLSTTTRPHHAVLLFSTSVSVLAYEILLMRLMSIGHWHHFAYMVISISLLGYGAAGSLIFLLLGKIRKHPDEWLIILAGATAVSFSLAFSISQRVNLDPLQLAWQPGQWGAMLLTYVFMAVPFLLAGGIVGIILTGAGEQAHRMYAVDLMGAGSGVLVIIPALYLGLPWELIPAAGCIILAGSSYFILRMERPRLGAAVILFSAGILAMAYYLFSPMPRIHEAKALPRTLTFPDAQIEARTVGPLGMIHVVGSDLIRHAPGLSLNFGIAEGEREASIPEQKALMLDADTLGAITRFSGDPDELEYLDFTTMALPYHVRHPERVLVVGAGGGADVLLGLKNQSAEIVALEVNRQVADLLRSPFAEFSGHLFSRPGVSLETRDARQFLHGTSDRFDLINLSLLDSPVTSAGGLRSATETYLYTTEAFETYLSHLTDSGILAVTRWLKLPPRDSLRIIDTALTAMRSMQLTDDPSRHIIFMRSWKTGTILLSKSAFTDQDISRALAFSEKRRFDLAYFPGMTEEQANRFDIHEAPYYFNGTSALFGAEAKSFLDHYIFEVSAVSDDRPYFSHFFRWDKAPALYRHLRREWFPMIELGYLFILATLVQAVIAGGVFILLPLFFLRRMYQPKGQASKPNLSVILGVLFYFASIGMAFMFLEMALLPKYTLLLSHPVYAAGLVLGGLLVFAGLGSLSIRRFQAKGSWFLWISFGVILLWVTFQSTLGSRLLNAAMAWPLGGRMALAVLLISVLAFFLGWPFPSGLRFMSDKWPGLIPWAWGVNGCASVVGAVLGKCLAVSIGFRSLMFTACALYFLAFIIFNVLMKKDGWI